MAKEMKSRRDLVTLIKEELRREPECADIELGITKGNNEGAYWTVYMLAEGTAHPCFLKAVRIAKRLSKLYNVAR